MTPDRFCPVCHFPLFYIREATRETNRRPDGRGEPEPTGFALYRCVVHDIWRVFGDGRIEPNDRPGPGP